MYKIGKGHINNYGQFESDAQRKHRQIQPNDAIKRQKHEINPTIIKRLNNKVNLVYN